MKSIKLNLILTSLLFFSLASCIDKKSEFKKMTVIKVDDESLDTQEFADMLASQMKSFDALSVKNKENLDRVKEEVIKSFIVSSLTKKWAEKNSVAVDEKELISKINEIRAQYPDDLTFRRSMAGEHLSIDQWKKDLRRTLLQEKLFHHLSTKLEKPDEKTMREYYKKNKDAFRIPQQIKVQQIVTERQDTAESLVKELKKGKKFDDLAKEFSISPEGKNGGYTGWIDVDTLEIFQKAYKLRKNKKNTILKSPFGYHIIRVVNRRSEGLLDFKMASERISKELLLQKENETYLKWLDENLRQAKVFRNEELISSIVVDTLHN